MYEILNERVHPIMNEVLKSENIKAKLINN